MSSLDNLRRLLPPPARPRNVGTPEEWIKAEQRLGTRLPSDYKEFISVYGSGAVDKFLIIFNACSDDGDNLWRAGEMRVTDVFKILREEFPEDFDWPLFPEPGGWLPFADTDWGAPLFWVTGGDPDTWPVVVAEGHLPDVVQHYQENMTSFLEGLLSRRLRCEWLQGSNLAPVGSSVYRDPSYEPPPKPPGLRLVRPDE